MSYADGNSDKRRKALTGGTVALIQVGLGLALINGLAVHFIEHAPEHPTAGIQMPLPPPPPRPLDEPTPKATAKVIKDNFVKTPEPKTPVVLDPTLDVTPPVFVDPLRNVGNDQKIDFIPHVVPSDPPARFQPKAAKPNNTVARWVTTDDYPTSDLRLGHTGTVRFRLTIDAEGRVSDCTIVKSSGYEGLDKATCHNLTRRARFDPASDAAGENVAGSYAGTIRWMIPQD